MFSNPLSVSLAIAAALLLLLSVLSFFISVSRKKMGWIYAALLLFLLCIGLSLYILFRFLWSAL
ncbi:MAG: hypothetical protein JNL72_05250 [Flavipsychrobacter sp.]|nr:hypothetical protein [Flavipsychrobacter sp.]